MSTSVTPNGAFWREFLTRTDVVGICLDKASVIRLGGARVVGINNEMIAAERRYITAAASVANLTDCSAERLTRSTPNLTNSFRETRVVTHTTSRDATRPDTDV